MMSKKLEKIEKIGAIFFFGGVWWEGGRNVPQRAPKDITSEVGLFL